MIFRADRAAIPALAIALLVAIAVALRLTTPPSPRPIDAPAAVFSAGRAMRDVAVIGRAPHPVGTAAHARVRAYLLARLRALGLQTAVAAIPLAGGPAERLARWSRQDVSRVTLFDIVATWPGADRAAPALVLMAHYDTVWGSPGAADDTAGVVTVVEEIRALRAAGVRPARDVVLLFTDGEELGLAGAHPFFERPGIAAQVGMVVNHETRGGGGRTAMFETGLGNGPAMRLFARAVPHPLTTSFAVLAYRLMPNSTDLTVALKQGLPGFNFAYVGRPSLYHSPLATPAAIEPASIQDMGDQSLALTRALATTPTLPPKGGDAAFGDLLGLTTIVYPVAAGWVPLGLAALLLALAARRLRHDGRIATTDVGSGIVTAAFTTTLAAPLLAAANALSIGWTKAEYYDRLAAIHRLEVQAASLCVAALLIGSAARRSRARWIAPGAVLAIGLLASLLGGDPIAGLTALPPALLAFFLPVRRPDPWAAWVGASLLLLGVAAIVQLAAPLAGALFAWPALVAAGSIATLAARDRPTTLVALALPLGLATAQLLALAHFTFSGIGAPMPIVMLLFLIGIVAVLRPLLGPRPAGPARTALVALCVIAAVAIALWVRLDPVAPSVPTYLGR